MFDGCLPPLHNAPSEQIRFRLRWKGRPSFYRRLLLLMENKVNFDPQMSIAELLHDWPQAIPVFIKYRMACVGCSMASFETLQSAAGIYHIPEEKLIQEIAQAIDLNPQRSNGKGAAQ